MSNNFQPKVISLFLVLFLICFYFLTQGRTLEYGYVDGSVMYNVTRSLVEYGDLKSMVPAFYRGESFITHSKYGLGLSLASVPLYVSFKYASQFINMEFKESLIRRSPIYTNAIITGLGCLVLFWILLMFTKNQKDCLGLSLLYGLSTMALVYSRSDFSEPLNTLCLLLSFYFLYQGRTKTLTEKNLVWSGFWMGAALLTRPASLIMIPLWLWQIIQGHSAGTSWKLKIKSVLVWAVPLGLFILIILWYNFYRYGSIFKTGYEVDFHDSHQIKVFWTGLWGLTFGAGKGIVWYNPILWAAVPGFYYLFRKNRNMGFWISGIFLIHLLLYSGWACWEGGWCWGPRNLIPAIPFLFIPILFLLKGLTHQKRVVWDSLLVLGFVGLGVQFLGMVFPYGSYIQFMLNKGVLYEELWTQTINSPLIGHFYILTKFPPRVWNFLVLNIFYNPDYYWVIFSSILFLLVMAYSAWQLALFIRKPSSQD